MQESTEWHSRLLKNRKECFSQLTSSPAEGGMTASNSNAWMNTFSKYQSQDFKMETRSLWRVRTGASSAETFIRKPCRRLKTATTSFFQMSLSSQISRWDAQRGMFSIWSQIKTTCSGSTLSARSVSSILKLRERNTLDKRRLWRNRKQEKDKSFSLKNSLSRTSKKRNQTLNNQ